MRLKEFTQTILEKGLSAAELKKRNNLALFIRKLEDGQDFLTVDGKLVKFLPTEELIDQLRNGNIPTVLPLAPQGTLSLSKLQKTAEFGGEEPGKRLDKEIKAMGSLAQQIEFAKQDTPFILLKVGNVQVKAAGVRNTPGTPKSDFEIIDDQGKSVAWISHKDGNPAQPQKFGQWSGISKFLKHADVKSFLEKFGAMYPQGFIKGETSVSGPITDEHFKMQSVYGFNYGQDRFGINNVTTVLQGPPILTRNQDGYELTALRDWPNGTPFAAGDPYEPIIIARYASDRQDAGFPHTRILIYPALGRKIQWA